MYLWIFILHFALEPIKALFCHSMVPALAIRSPFRWLLCSFDHVLFSLFEPFLASWHYEGLQAPGPLTDQSLLSLALSFCCGHAAPQNRADRICYWKGPSVDRTAWYPELSVESSRANPQRSKWNNSRIITAWVAPRPAAPAMAFASWDHSVFEVCLDIPEPLKVKMFDQLY